MGKLRSFYLVLTIALCGGVVMALEILGTRVIGTFYGGSLAIWGALITVTLVSLSVGSYFIGMLADRYPRPVYLYLLVLLAAAAALLVFVGKSILLPVYTAFGAQGGAVVSAFVIFTPSIALLGGVGPFAIKLMVSEVHRLGKGAGSIYAISTVGSVIGTLAASFVLIPRFGTTDTVVGIILLLTLLAVGGLTIEWGKRGALLLPLVVVPWLVVPSPSVAGNENISLLWRGESLYSRFVVVDNRKNGERMVLVNGIQQTGMPLDETKLEADVQLLSNSYYLELLPYYKFGSRALLVGLAGGMLPRVLHGHGIETTAVDVDEMALHVARTHFGYKGKAVIQDGRRYVEDCRESYDFCILDAYSSDVIPFHLVTEEMFRAVRKVLSNDGILAVNYIGDPRGETLGSVVKTVAKVFDGHVKVYQTQDDAEIQTIFVFASPVPLRLAPLWQLQEESGGSDPLLRELARREISPDRLPGVVLTDDRNPIDLLRAEESLQWRRKALETFGELLLW